jgi:uncharacterized membrane protein
MVAYTTRRKGYRLGHFVARGAILIGLGAFLELAVWRFYPFVSADVLYLIGVSLPLAHLSLRWSARGRWAVMAAIFLATPILQQAVGYSEYPTELALATKADADDVDLGVIVNHWLLDGWFPLFPWLGLALAGVNLAEIRAPKTARAPAWARQTLLIGLGLVACGGVVWWLHPGDQLTRGGYSELFYPPTPGFIITAIGAALLLLATVDFNPALSLYRPLRLLGESALSMYLLHIVIIKYLVGPDWQEEPLEMFAALYASLLIALVLIAYAERRFKALWKHPPFAVRILLGG